MIQGVVENFSSSHLPNKIETIHPTSMREVNLVAALFFIYFLPIQRISFVLQPSRTDCLAIPAQKPSLLIKKGLCANAEVISLQSGFFIYWKTSFLLHIIYCKSCFVNVQFNAAKSRRSFWCRISMARLFLMLSAGLSSKKQSIRSAFMNATVDKNGIRPLMYPLPSHR